jgi:RNA polymerase sigma factor (sigma-70 family)
MNDMERSIGIEETYRAERNRLINWLARRVGNEAAEDLLHDVVVRAITNFDSLEPVRDMAAWLWASAKNAVIDAWRKRETKRAAGEIELDDFDAIVDEAWRSLSDETERDELLEALERAIEKLSDEQREVIVAQVLNGETFKSISERTGASIETLAARKRYALAKLRLSLKDFATEERDA